MNNDQLRRDIESQISRSVQGQKQVQLANTSSIIYGSPCGFADPKPLGIFSFSVTTTVLSLINIQARSVTVPNIMIGLAYGGFAQFIAGMWAFAVGDSFNALVFSSYGTFWISYALIMIPWFNIASAYGDNLQEFQSAVGHYLVGWLILSAVLTIATLRSSIALFGLFLHLTSTFLILVIGYYNNENVHCIKAGGYVGLITALFGWYNGVSLIWNKENSWIHLPVGRFPWVSRDRFHGKHAECDCDVEVQ